jgi:hypothetical protein
MVDLVAGELDRVHERIAGRFGRAEPRARVREYVCGLVAGLGRKNRWTLAKHAGEAGPDGMPVSASPDPVPLPQPPLPPAASGCGPVLSADSPR